VRDSSHRVTCRGRGGNETTFHHALTCLHVMVAGEADTVVWVSSFNAMRGLLGQGDGDQWPRLRWKGLQGHVVVWARVIWGFGILMPRA